MNRNFSDNSTRPVTELVQLKNGQWIDPLEARPIQSGESVTVSASWKIENRLFEVRPDAHGLQIFAQGLNEPIGILDVFDGKMQFLLFDQEFDEPKVIAKIDQKSGKITSVISACEKTEVKPGSAN